MDGLQAGPTAEEIAASEASVRAAQASVWSASGSVTAAEDVSEADIAAAQKALDAALDDQQAAHDAWVDLAICKVNVEGTIAPDQLSFIFDRLYRGDTSRQRDRESTGLGLPISLALVEAHGGTITADSSGENRGSTFTISLPLS